MLWLQTNKQNSGTMNLGGSLTRQIESDNTVNETNPHIANIGRMVEVSITCLCLTSIFKSNFFCQDMENKIRNTLNEIYFGKTNSILNGLRSVNSLSEQRAHEALKSDLAQALQKRQKGDLSN